MKFFQNLVWVAIFSLSGTVAAQTPVYLDETKPMEDRIEDALSRMTLEFVPRSFGTNGTKQGGRTILVWHSRH